MALTKGSKNKVKREWSCPDCKETDLEKKSTSYYCRSCACERVKISRRAVKNEVLSQYSGGGYPHCQCCWDQHIDFLSIDHVNGGGSEHRRQLGMSGGHSFYSWLKRNGYPDGYRVLCQHCNQGRQCNNGICPHEEE